MCENKTFYPLQRHYGGKMLVPHCSCLYI